MIRPVKQRHLDIYNRITGQDARIQSLPYTFLNCRYIFPRDRPADNLIFKHKTFSGRLRLHRNPDVTVLTTPAGLPEPASAGTHPSFPDLSLSWALLQCLLQAQETPSSRVLQDSPCHTKYLP